MGTIYSVVEFHLENGKPCKYVAAKRLHVVGSYFYPLLLADMISISALKKCAWVVFTGALATAAMT